MREILFRGKHKGYGQWVYGDLLQITNMARCSIMEQTACAANIEVVPETVGQYTGLTDKNGKKIFEGDIVRYTERRLGGEDVPVVNAVEFAEGGFAVHNYFLNHWLWDGANGNIQMEGIEVIGNIHDNPELLGGAGNA